MFSSRVTTCTGRNINNERIGWIIVTGRWDRSVEICCKGIIFTSNADVSWHNRIHTAFCSHKSNRSALNVERHVECSLDIKPFRTVTGLRNLFIKLYNGPHQRKQLGCQKCVSGQNNFFAFGKTRRNLQRNDTRKDKMNFRKSWMFRY